MKKYTFLTMTVVLTAMIASAQFPIKIPKVTIPKIERPKTEAPKSETTQQPSQTNQRRQTVSSPSADRRNGAAQYGDSPIIGKPQNRHMVMDDSFTIFDAEALEKRDAKLARYVNAGWYLAARFRILGTFPNRSAFRVFVKKNGKELSNTRCEGDVYRKDRDSQYDHIRGPGKDMNFEDFMRGGCADKTQAITELGKLDVEIYFIDGNTDAETLVRKHVIDVHEATTVDGLPAKSVPGISNYYVQRHAESSVAFANLAVHGAYPQGKTDTGYTNRPLQSSKSRDSAHLEIFSSIATSEDFSKTVIGTVARCSVNGQRIKFKRNGVNIRTEYLTGAVYSDRKAAKYKKGVAYEDKIRFSRVLFSFPIYSGNSPITDAIKLEDYPGRWECDVRSNGVVLRTFRWDVGPDGRIVPHPEQTNGNVNLFYNANLIEMEIPDGGTILDASLLPSPDSGFFYGIPWTSAEGKALAGRLPKKGNPYPVPSDKN